MFNQSSIHSGLLGMPMAKYGNFGSKMAVFEHFLGPKKTFPGVLNGYNRPPLDVKLYVQLCPTNLQPIWGRWDCLWPNMAISGHFGGFWGPPVPFLGGKKGPN